MTDFLRVLAETAGYVNRVALEHWDVTRDLALYALLASVCGLALLAHAAWTEQ